MDRNDAPASRARRIRDGDRRSIARAITSIENGTSDAQPLLAELDDARRHGRVVGITGPPGAGKSTLVSAIARELLGRNRSVAIIAVDPSSPISGGAVLGDRVRMGDVQGDDRIFIRSLATRGHLGGLTRTTRDVVRVLDAAGFDDIIVETVGAGQSEVEIAGVAGTRIVVCPPGLGDDVQASKAGILEIADILVINKADLPDAERTEHDLRAMLALRGGRAPKPPVMRTVATSGAGVVELVDAIARHADGVRNVVAETSSTGASPPPSGEARPFLRQRSLAARDHYMAHLDAGLVEGGAGRAVVAMQVRREHLNFLGGCHGGALFSLADMALGLACNSHPKVAALIDAHVAFPVAVAQGDRLVATATEVARSRRLGRYRIEVMRGDDVVASMMATVYVTDREIDA